MNVQNNTSNFYYIGNYPLSAGATIVVPNYDYDNDDAIAKQINSLDDTNDITVSSTPAGYPRTFGSAVNNDALVPSGGTAGQYLKKSSGADYDDEWATIAASGWEYLGDWTNATSYTADESVVKGLDSNYYICTQSHTSSTSNWAGSGQSSADYWKPLSDNTVIKFYLTAPDGALATGDGKAFFRVPLSLHGYNLISAAASLVTASSSGTPTFQLRRRRSGSDVDMLSTALTVDANETDSATAATAAVVNTSNDDIQQKDQIFVDCDVAGTGTQGVEIEIIVGTV